MYTSATFTVNHKTYMKFAFNIEGQYDVSIVLTFGNGQLKVEVVHDMTVYNFDTIPCSLADMSNIFDTAMDYFDENFALQFVLEVA